MCKLFLKKGSLFGLLVVMLLGVALIGGCEEAPPEEAAEEEEVEEEVAYPEREVEMLCMFREGGSIDRMTRSLAPHLEEELGVPVTVRNVPGGGTILGTEEYMALEPDGHYLYTNVQPGLSYAHHILGGDYTVDDFAWLNVQEQDFNSILVPYDSPFEDIKDLMILPHKPMV